MTTWSDNRRPYEAPATIDEWLIKRRISINYSAVFTWDEEQVRSDYEDLFNEIEAYNERIDELESKFQTLHQSRLEYMEVHDINNWHTLDPIRDAEHLTQNASFSDDIVACNTEGKKLKKEREAKGRVLPLLAGIIDGSYSDFSSIINDERSVHGLMSSNSGDPMWDYIGPLHNIRWGMYPKLD